MVLDEVMKEAIIKKYAELTGKSEDEARAILEPIFAAGDEEKIKELLVLLDGISQSSSGVAKEVAEAAKAALAASVAQKHFSTAPRLERVLDKITELQLTLQVLDRLLAKKREDDTTMIMNVINQRFQVLESTLTKLVETLTKQSQQQQQQLLVQALENLQKAFQQQLEELRKQLDKHVSKKKTLTVDEIEEIKKKLEALGFEVKKAGTEFDIEKAKQYLKKLGYKIEPGWISADQLQKILEQERERIRKEIREKVLQEIEKEKIDAAEKVVTTAIDRLFNLLSPVIPEVMRGMFGASGTSVSKTSTSSQVIIQETSKVEEAPPAKELEDY
ncbi:MAG: hypothetical protein DRP11_05280, partial [Candidatus Aenigmatarchaeota archaeon]